MNQFSDLPFNNDAEDDKVIVKIGDTVIFNNFDSNEETHFTVKDICVKFVENATWQLVFVLLNSKTNLVEEVPDFIFMDLLRKMEFYTPRFRETAIKYKFLKTKRNTNEE